MLLDECRAHKVTQDTDGKCLGNDDDCVLSAVVLPLIRCLCSLFASLPIKTWSTHSLIYQRFDLKSKHLPADSTVNRHLAFCLKLTLQEIQFREWRRRSVYISKFVTDTVTQKSFNKEKSICSLLRSKISQQDTWLMWGFSLWLSGFGMFALTTTQPLYFTNFKAQV